MVQMVWCSGDCGAGWHSITVISLYYPPGNRGVGGGTGSGQRHAPPSTLHFPPYASTNTSTSLCWPDVQLILAHESRVHINGLPFFVIPIKMHTFGVECS